MSTGGAVIRLDEIESTQDYAKKLLDEGKAEEGTCVVARRQTAGRGRRGRSWLAPDGGLFLSMVVFPRCRLTEAAHLTLGAADGMLRAMDALGVVDARVKWPNDVLVPHAQGPNGKLGPFRKVAGVLVEAVRAVDDRLEACVLGVGVNVAPPDEGWPEDIALTAGALADAGFRGGADDVLEAVRAAMPAALRRSLDAWEHTLATLRARSATLGRRVEVDDIVGEARAIDDDGALVVVDDAGTEHTVRAGDVWLV